MKNMKKIEIDLLDATVKPDEWNQSNASNKQIIRKLNHLIGEARRRELKLSAQLQKAKAQIQRESSRRKQAEKKLHTCQSRLRALTSELLLTEERERHRLAQDLHDTVAQCLAGCRYKLETLQANTDSGSRPGQVDDCIDFIEQAIKQTRLLMFGFYPWILNESGLETTLRSLALRVHEAHGIQVECIADGIPDTLDKDLRVFLFRIVRELLINVVKHAQAQHATISIGSTDSRIRISVVDDGIGFNIVGLVNEKENTNGFGLFSIRERLGQLGGRLKITSQPGQGTHAAVVIPAAMKSNFNK